MCILRFTTSVFKIPTEQYLSSFHDISAAGRHSNCLLPYKTFRCYLCLTSVALQFLHYILAGWTTAFLAGQWISLQIVNHTRITGTYLSAYITAPTCFTRTWIHIFLFLFWRLGFTRTNSILDHLHIIWKPIGSAGLQLEEHTPSILSILEILEMEDLEIPGTSTGPELYPQIAVPEMACRDVKRAEENPGSTTTWVT